MSDLSNLHSALSMSRINSALIAATLAPILNSIQLVPQLYKTYVTKSSKDISLHSLLLILATSFLWALHGYFIADQALFIASMVAFSVNLSLLTLVIYERKLFHV